MEQTGGKALEKTVLQLFKRYEQLNIHCQQNFPEQLMSGLKVRKHGFDFQCFHKGIFVAFDAKHCQGDKFYLSNCKMHQIKALKNIKNHGGEGFFLVYYAMQKKLNRLDVDMVMELLEQNIKYDTFDINKQTSIDILNIF